MTENKSVLAIGAVETRQQAERLLGLLRESGFSSDSLSVILPEDVPANDSKLKLDHAPGQDPADEKQGQVSEKIQSLTIGALSGGVMMGALGGLIGLASLAIPGVGLFVVGGPLVAALADAAAGGAAGIIAGAVMGMRIPDHQAKQYEKSVREGHTLVCVHTTGTDMLQKAIRVLAAGGAKETHEVLKQTD
jgi:hypothetical protein